MPKDMDDYDDLVEEQLEALKEQKKAKRRKEEKKKQNLLQKWRDTDTKECSCDESGTAIFSSHSLSLLREREDFEMATEADELWVCEECGRIPSEEEVRSRGLDRKR